jgi:hypothetical protein
MEKINWLTLFKEIIVVYSEGNARTIDTVYEQNGDLLSVKTGVIYSYHCALNR